MDGLYDEPRLGAPRTIDDARIEAEIITTLETVSENVTHCSGSRRSRTAARWRAKSSCFFSV
ncbi:hypothetical protein [Bradyrhizobium sp. SRL28]|uniref:hypothetical protein n=1 Tax=Bradyrhizobium sp. SRL28 TaxID=2836178 RepID=UPI0035AE80F7